MHPASVFKESDRRRLRTLVAASGLAVIVAAAGRPLVAHAPVLLADDRRLRFHLSAANELCAVLAGGCRALAVITGPDAYVSPDWYESSDQVPTWNYLSVEIEGPVRPLSRPETAVLLDELAAHFEARLAPKPAWTRQKMTPGRFETMLGAIVGFEMSVERLEGTFKLSQNKPVDEIARIATHLARRRDSGSRRIAGLMTATRGGLPGGQDGLE